MKKLWNKIRKWLIKKLGAVEDTPIVPSKICVMPSDIIKVYGVQTIPSWYLTGRKGEVESVLCRAKREVAWQIAAELLDKEYIRFETNENALTMETKISGTLMVCDRRW